MNPRFRKRVESCIDNAMQVYYEAKTEKHPGLAGLVREIALEMLLRPLLPQTVGVGTGKIIDSYGNESRQIDIILHHPDTLPAAMYGDRFGLFPVESCLYAIEVKSTATSANAQSACKVARSISVLRPRPGFYASLPTMSESGNLVAKRESFGRYPNFGYFAFSTDLRPGGEESSELERFLEVLEKESHHSIHLVVLSIAGKVTSSWSRQQKQWRHVPHTDSYDEVVYFLSSILNTVAKMFVTRTPPNIGAYLWDAD